MWTPLSLTEGPYDCPTTLTSGSLRNCVNMASVARAVATPCHPGFLVLAESSCRRGPLQFLWCGH
eukprot:5400572-Lingulodinium_polyedra.AAC.1